MDKKSSKKAFTLMELLVVISIIAVLLAILMPSLNKARKMARRAVCGSDLRQWGTMCYNFTVSHDGKLPRAFHHEVCGVMPTCLNDVTAKKTRGKYDDYENGAWLKFGVPWDILVKFGLSEKITICPSQTWLKSWNGRGDKLVFMEDGFIDIGGWRRNVMQTYTFVSGMTPMHPSLDNTRDKPFKTYQISGQQASTRVVAADTVAWADGVWKERYPTRNMLLVNHPGGKEGMVDSQNILFGDGHVEVFGSNYYSYDIRKDLTFTGGPEADWCVIHRPDGGPWFYWNGARSRAR